MIIDSHVHIGSSQYLHVSADGDFLVRLADELGFDRIFCTDLTALFYDHAEGNRVLAREMKRHPDRIIGYVTLTSHRYGREAVNEVRRGYEVHGMRGLKTYSYPEAPVTEQDMIPILEITAELRMPVLCHATPDECQAMARRVPESTILMAHMGGHPWAKGNWHRAIEAAETCPNLHLDTATSQIDAGMIEAAVARVGVERVIFGTDMPLLDPWTQLGKIRHAEISKEAKSLILGGNMARLLGLDGLGNPKSQRPNPNQIPKSKSQR